jgi:drug/metabolite transporter (DMT)-like permease
MTRFAAPLPLPRHLAVAVLLFVGFFAASNHIAAHIAFDNKAGLLLAVMCRSGAAVLALLAIVLWQRHKLVLPVRLAWWLFLLGILIALQSLSLYSAISRIPVALALLIGNLFPILLALLTWVLGGEPPTRRTSILMGVILIGLVFVLDLPGWIAANQDVGPHWMSGIFFAFGSAFLFAIGLWITGRHLSAMAGPVRGMYTILIVFCSMVVAGLAGIVPGGMSTPDNGSGWVALAVLSLCYATSFSVLFVFIPRLDMATNAPVMNSEPVFSLILGWMILDQFFNTLQLIGGAIVLACIVTLASSKKR